MIPEWNSFINGDCMDYLKEFPDNYFSLALVDPPYGAGFTESGGCKGWFSKYHQNAETPEILGGAERKRNSITGSEVKAHVSKSTRTHYTNGMRKCRKNYKKILEDENRKKSYRGTLPLKENTLNSSFVSHGIR